MLSIVAVISLALGLFQDLGTPNKLGEVPVDWVEGLAIIVVILIVVCYPLHLLCSYTSQHFQIVVGFFSDWQKEQRLKALNEKTEERGIGVKVIRNGIEIIIDIEVHSYSTSRNLILNVTYTI